MKKLIYYIEKVGYMEPFYEYDANDVGADEFYARQLCTYFIMQGKQYERLSNEMEAGAEVVVLKELGSNVRGEGEQSFRGQGIHIEFRSAHAGYPLVDRISCATHFDVMRYLLKDIVEVPSVGQMLVTSTEIDEDRGVYVMYVTDLE
ncbi:MAG: RNA helicase [Solibacillus sp.]